MIEKEDVDRIVMELSERLTKMWATNPDLFPEYEKGEGFGEGVVEDVVMRISTLAISDMANENSIDGETVSIDGHDLVENIAASVQMAFLVGWELHKQMGES